MGNQQERSNAWLAGIIDGEGSISFQVYTKPDGRIRITPYICVMNTDKGILDEVDRIMGGLLEHSTDAKLRWCNVTNTSAKSFKSRAECKCLRVDGVAVKFILDAITPHLRSVKRDYAGVMYQYLDSRKDGLLLRDTLGRIQRVGYRRSEVELIAKTRTSKLAKSSEAICSAPNVIAG